MKTFLLYNLLLFVLLVGGALLSWQPFLGRVVGEAVFAKAVEKGLDSDVSDVIEDYIQSPLIVGICGAGSPLPDALRSGPCTFVKAGDRVFVVDAGAGSSKSLALMRVNPSQIEAVLLTHFHSDHIDGLGALMLQYWAATGAKKPLEVMGPQGVEQIAKGFNIAYELDKGYRIAHHGEHFLAPEGFGLRARTLDTMENANDTQVVYSADDLRITVFPVDHSPVHPAVGYRFDYGDRSVVISGDTRATESILLRSKEVDLLVHEALQPQLVAVIQRLGRERGARIGHIAADIPDYHTSPEEVAEIAQAAGVRHVLLTHIVPPLPTPLLHEAFLGKARGKFNGDLQIANDGTMVVLPQDSEEVLLYETLQ